MGNASGGNKGLGRTTPEQNSRSPSHRLPLSPMGTTTSTAALMAAPSLGKELSRRPAPGQAAGGSLSQSKQQPRGCPTEHVSNCRWPQPPLGTRQECWQPAVMGKALGSKQPPATPGKPLLQRGSGTAGAPPCSPRHTCCHSLQLTGTGNGTRTLLWIQSGTSRGRGAARQLVRKSLQNAVLKHDPGSRRLTCLVATSERFRRVQRQFWTSLGLELVRCLPNACMPPAGEGDTSPSVNTQSCPRREEKGETVGLRGEWGLGTTRLRPPTHDAASRLSRG